MPGHHQASSAATSLSLSATHATRPPNTACTAMSRPPYPVNSDPIRTSPAQDASVSLACHSRRASPAAAVPLFTG